MSGRQWKFQTDGSITDGVNSVKFTELVKFNPATNRVEDISGNPAPIAVTDATTLNGLGGSSYLTKNETSVNGKGIISGNIDFSAIDMEEVVSQAMVTYTGGGMHPNVPMTGLELLPNIDFTNTNSVVVENAANLSVASNKLRVTKSTVDNPVVYETVTLEANKTYRVKLGRFNVGSGVTTRLSVVDGSNNEVVGYTPTTDVMLIDLGFTTQTAGTYKVKITTYTTTVSVGCEYYLFSCKEVNLSALSYNQYVTYKDNNVGKSFTEVVTNIESMPLEYRSYNSYSNVTYNNLAFFYDSFDLLQYISPTSGLTGFIKDGLNNDVEYLKDGNGKWIGDFKTLTAGEQAANINLFGSGSKTVDGTSGLLTIQRTALDYVTPTLKASFNFNGIAAGGYYMISFYIEDIIGEWYVDIYNGSTTVRYPLANATGNISQTPTTLRNCVYENKTVRLIVKSQGIPGIVSILRDNVLNNPILLTDKISFKLLSVKALDSAVWRVLTPDNKMESSPMMNWKSSDIQFMPNQQADVTNSHGGNHIRFSQSFLGNGYFTGAAGDIYRWKVFGANLQNASHEMDQFIQYTTKGFRIYYGGLSLFNIKDVQYGATQTSYNKVRIYRDEHGKLQLIVSDPTAGVSTTLFQYACNSTKKLKQEIKHDLLDIPSSVTISNMNNRPTDVWNNYNVYSRVNKEQNPKLLTPGLTTSKDDMLAIVYKLNDNTITNTGIDYAGSWLQIKKDSLNIVSLNTYYNVYEYSLNIVRCSVDNQNRKTIFYKGNNKPRILKTDFKPLFMQNATIANPKVKKVQLVNKLFGLDTYCALDNNVTGYLKPTYGVVALTDNGVGLLECNTSATDGNLGCIEKFNGAVLPGSVGSDFWYIAHIFGTADGSYFSTVKRPKPTAKLAINNLVVSTLTTTNEVVGNKYTTTKTNKNFGE